jgi:hypothetical protein
MLFVKAKGAATTSVWVKREYFSDAVNDPSSPDSPGLAISAVRTPSAQRHQIPLEQLLWGFLISSKPGFD